VIAAVRAWLREKAKDDLDEALSWQRDSAALVKEMRYRESGAGDWNAAAWKGETKKEQRSLAAAKKRVKQMRAVVRWLGAS
jgi:hypothetical protein